MCSSLIQVSKFSYTKWSTAIWPFLTRHRLATLPCKRESDWLWPCISDAISVTTDCYTPRVRSGNLFKKWRFNCNCEAIVPSRSTIKLWIISTVRCAVEIFEIISRISLKRKDKCWQSLLLNTEWCYRNFLLLNCVVMGSTWTLCGSSPHC